MIRPIQIPAGGRPHSTRRSAISKPLSKPPGFDGPKVGRTRPLTSPLTTVFLIFFNPYWFTINKFSKQAAEPAFGGSWSSPWAGRRFRT